MEKITLTEILTEYRNLLGERITTSDEEFFRQKRKEFREILHTFSFEEEINGLKEGKNYSLMQKHKQYIIRLYEEFSTSEFKKMRKGKYESVDTEYLVKATESFIKFISEYLGGEELDEIILKVYNTTNYPLRKRQLTATYIKDRLDVTIEKVFESKILNRLSGNDKYAWLFGLQQDFKLLIERWEKLFDIMGEIRQDEVNDLAIEEAESMSEDEQFAAEVEWGLAGVYLNALKNNKEYKEFIKERDELLNDSRGFVADKKKKLRIIQEKIRSIHDEVIESINREYLSLEDIERLNQSKEQEPSFDNLQSSEHLLKSAIKEYLDDIEFNKIVEEHRMAMKELPDINFEEIEKELENLRCKIK